MTTLLTQTKAEELLLLNKESVLREVFFWLPDAKQEELFVESADKDRKFVLNLNRNPFEIRLHFRTKSGSLGLARIDNALQHINPDGNVLHGPHLRWYPFLATLTA